MYTNTVSPSFNSSLHTSQSPQKNTRGIDFKNLVEQHSKTTHLSLTFTAELKLNQVKCLNLFLNCLPQLQSISVCGHSELGTAYLLELSGKRPSLDIWFI